MKYTVRQYSIKIFWAVVNPLRHVYWFVVRPRTTGVKCLIEKDGSFLLVRLNYAHRMWTLPGGSVDSGETPEEASMREVAEEVGIHASGMDKLGEYITTRQYKINTVHVFYYPAQSRDFKIDGFEIAEAAWFTPDDLPSNRRETVDDIIAMHRARLP